MKKIYQIRVIFAGTETSIRNRVNKCLFKMPVEFSIVKIDFGYSEKKHWAYIMTSQEVPYDMEWLDFKSSDQNKFEEQDINE